MDAIKKMENHELKYANIAVEHLTRENDQLKVRVQSLLGKVKWEQGRTNAQEDKVTDLEAKVDQLQEDLGMITKERDSIQQELSILRGKSTETAWRTQYESDIIHYRAKIAGLESRLTRRQEDFENSEQTLRDKIYQLQELLDNAQTQLVETSYGNVNPLDGEKSNDLHYKIGDLTATNKALQDELTRNADEKAELQQEVKSLREEIESQKGLNNALQSKLSKTEGSNDSLTKHYTDEISKLKQQKTDVRLELLRLRRELEERKNNEDDPKVADGKEEVAELKKTINELEHQLADAKRKIAENESSEEGKIQHLIDDLKKANATNAENHEALTKLDREHEDLIIKIQDERAARKAMKEKNGKLEAEIKDLKQRLEENKILLEEEIASLKSINGKLMEQLDLLQHELRLTHTDQRY